MCHALINFTVPMNIRRLYIQPVLLYNYWSSQCFLKSWYTMAYYIVPEAVHVYFFLRTYRMIIYYYTQFVTRFYRCVGRVYWKYLYSVQSYLYWMPDLKCISIWYVLTQTCKWHIRGLRFEI